MKEIALVPRPLTAAVAREMEERKLVSFLRHPSDAVRRSLAKDFLKGRDFPAPIHGFHSVTITYTDIYLASHPRGQDEIVYNWDDSRRTRPLFFIFALLARDRYLKRLKAGRVDASDYLALRAPMNDPRFGSFVVWHGTVHCECTAAGGRALPYPSFFVLEPRKLVVARTEEEANGVKLVLGRRGER